MTVRQVFYRLTSEAVIDKTEAEYKGTVCRLLGEMRRSGEIPYYWLADATRWMRKPKTFDSVEEALRNTARTYRRSLWSDAEVAVEIWLEKEALAGVLVEVTEEWDAPLMVTRGYPSLSFLYDAAESMRARREHGQRTHIYYLGDRDPSGLDIDRFVQDGITEALTSMVGGEHFFRAMDMFFTLAGETVGGRGAFPTFENYATFQRIAVTEDQIEAWDLPTRPTKKTDSRSKNFEGESVELDAIPPGRLKQLCRDAIERHVDQARLDVLRTYEESERADIKRIAAMLDGDK